jgi:hypothetical protein
MATPEQTQKLLVKAIRRTRRQWQRFIKADGEDHPAEILDQLREQLRFEAHEASALLERVLSGSRPAAAELLEADGIHQLAGFTPRRPAASRPPESEVDRGPQSDR